MKGKNPLFAKNKAIVPDLPDSLTRSQKNRIVNGYTNIRDHVTEKDIEGAIEEIKGCGIKKRDGTLWQHYKEVDEAVKGIIKDKGSLEKSIKNPGINPDAEKSINNAIKDFEIVINNWNKIKGNN